MIALFPLCLVSVVGLYGEGGASLGGWPGPRGQAVLVPKLLPRHDLVLTRSVSWLLLDKYLMQMALIFCMDVWQICCVDGINNLCEWNSHLVWITVINCMNDMIFCVDDIDILCESHWYLVWLTLIFSSPEPKAQVSFSDHNLSVVRRRRCSCCKFFTFSSYSPEPLGKFQPNLVQSILGWQGFKFVQMKGSALYKGEIITKLRKYIANFMKSSPEPLGEF